MDSPFAQIPVFGARKRAKELAEEVAQLRVELDRLGALSLAELERRRVALAEEIVSETGRLEQERAAAAAAIEAERAAAAERARAAAGAAEAARTELETRLQELRSEIVETEELAVLQEAGVYEYHHPLTDAVAYQSELKALRDQIKVMARADGGAVHGTTNWTVNNSVSQGRKMVRDFSKLMLRA
jgi:hypothetical protein